MLLERKDKFLEINLALNHSPAVALLGPRQCGKSTIARLLRPEHFFDLENPRDLVQFDQAQLTLERLKGLVVIDEVQRKPDLFPLLRYLIDQSNDKRFLLLGSASRQLVTQSSESLAGRISFIAMAGFNLTELEKTQENFEKLWLRGGFPRSFLASEDSIAEKWRDDYISTFLERDIPALGIRIPATTLRRFWIMLSHYHGQILNYSELATSFGISDNTVRHYLEILSGTYMIHLLPPWHANVKKRLVKKPKLYLTDSGIFHTLQTIGSFDQLMNFNKKGASWEGFVIQQILNSRSLPLNRYFFYASHGGAELDLFWQEGGKNYGAEIKYADAPGLTKSMKAVVEDLELEKLWVVHPASARYFLSEKIEAIGLRDFVSL
jgi:predicted AAA+ superfamily ATPase